MGGDDGYASGWGSILPNGVQLLPSKMKFFKSPSKPANDGQYQSLPKAIFFFGIEFAGMPNNGVQAHVMWAPANDAACSDHSAPHETAVAPNRHQIPSSRWYLNFFLSNLDQHRDIGERPLWSPAGPPQASLFERKSR